VVCKKGETYLISASGWFHYTLTDALKTKRSAWIIIAFHNNGIIIIIITIIIVVMVVLVTVITTVRLRASDVFPYIIYSNTIHPQTRTGQRCVYGNAKFNSVRVKVFPNLCFICISMQTMDVSGWMSVIVNMVQSVGCTWFLRNQWTLYKQMSSNPHFTCAWHSTTVLCF
jgi:hypothetical protein